jgi:hypothetical protein
MKRLFCRLSFLFALCMAPILTATQFVPLSIEALTQKSDLILQGTVLSKTTQRDSTGQIYTKVELAVAEVWKGSVSSNRFTILQGGGTLGEQTTVITGQAKFEIGEEVVAFLVVTPNGNGVILGLSQGKFRVWQDKSTGEKYSRNLFHGGAPPGGPIQLQQTSAANSSLKVTDLKQRVKQVGK